MANKGLNKVGVGVSDIPNIGSVITSNSYKAAIGGEATIFGITISHLEFKHNCSRIRALDCNN